MKTSEDLRYVDSSPSSRVGASMAVGAAVAAVGAAYLFALSQSGLLRSAATWWSDQPAPHGPAWALPAVAAGIAVAGISLGVVLLSWLTRSVAQHPYRWLGPVLVGFAVLVLQGMHLALPWRSVPYPLFIGLSGFALLSGGAVMQSSGWPARVSGGFVLSLPVLSLIVGYAATPIGVNAALRVEGAPLVWLVLGLTAVGVGLAALVGRSDSEYHVAQLRRRLKDNELKLVDAIEVGRWNQARLAAAEQRAQYAEQGVYQSPGGSYALDDDAAAFAAAARPRSLAPWFMLGLGMIGVGIAAGTYLGLYRPLLKRASAQQALMSESVQSHASELEQMRARFEAKQQSLQAELATARTPLDGAHALPARAPVAGPAAAEAAAPAKAEEPAKAAPPPRAAEEAKSKLQPAKAVVAPHTSSKAASAKAKRAANRRAKHAAAVAAAAKPKAAPAAKPAAPLSEADDLDRKMQRALKENENADDDPIGGLE